MRERQREQLSRCFHVREIHMCIFRSQIFDTLPLIIWNGSHLRLVLIRREGFTLAGDLEFFVRINWILILRPETTNCYLLSFSSYTSCLIFGSCVPVFILINSASSTSSTEITEQNFAVNSWLKTFANVFLSTEIVLRNCLDTVGAKSKCDIMKNGLPDFEIQREFITW